MPNNPSTTGAIISGGAGLLGTGINAFSQGQMNRKTRKWNEKMYGLQRQDALADWTRQNEYNHPSAQMARLKEAGLNPNLVYGSGATTEAGGIRGTESKGWNPRAPEVDLSPVGNSLMMYYDTEIKQAQVDNLRAQNTVAVQDALLKAAQVLQTTASTEKTGVETSRSKFDLSLAQELKETSIEAARSNVDKMKADTRYTLDRNEREAAMQAPNLMKAVEDVFLIRAQRENLDLSKGEIRGRILNLEKDATLKELDIRLRRLGIQPNDSMWLRMVGRLVDQLIKGKIGGPTTDPKFNPRTPGGMNPLLDLRRLLD